ncbi:MULTISPECIES: AraC family transcriptional regulator [Amycolatopsis]|uniref:AraC family transcriptional regulator n=1 Tax=Amycolatopsis thermalba TaxID=944492 RepID=A0ABY4NNF1_9PSEU|nr:MULTISPECIES: AraC family transcriptional regulator [Amycolatopsis]UQS22120.1 AraC family transcriptional regulator [Amycolatopsis thermalba]
MSGFHFAYIRTADPVLAVQAAEPVLGPHELLPEGFPKEMDLRMHRHEGDHLSSAIVTYGRDVVVRLGVPRTAYTTGIVVNGRCVFRVGSTYLEAVTGDVVTASPGDAFGFQAGANCYLKLVRVEQRAMHVRLARITGSWPARPIRFHPTITRLTGRGQPLITSAERFFGRSKSRFARHSDEIFVNWLLRHQPHEYSELIGPRAAEVGPLVSDFGKVLLQAADPDKEVSVTELARDAGVSEAEFVRIFRHYEGCLPEDFRQGMRLEQARRILVVGREPLVTVEYAARRSGFGDREEFWIRYTQRFGETPLETLDRLE